MALNKLSISSTRRLSIGLTTGAGALMFSAFNLFGTMVSTNNKFLAAKIATSIMPLAISAFFGLLSLIFTELADHPDVPLKGRFHSKTNYIESAFVYLSILGFGSLLYGSYLLIKAVTNYKL